ncbi:uncharacterized protein [Nicotiana tomentosiformis]|uniref:uncharacterized protein n=1 Tax=Nicotiana tomentosiformis TaxID=4098 RepID=UPI00388CB21E
MRKIELRKEEPNKDKTLVLKASEDDESDYDDPDLTMFAKFKRFMKNSKSASKRETSSKHKQIDKANYDGCYMCGKLDHIGAEERTTYEDSGSDQEEEKDDEAISLYVVIDELQVVKTEPQVQLGMHIGRPHLFDEYHYDKWKLRMEIFLQTTDFDLWVIFSHGPILPTKLDGEGNKCNKREEEYDEEDRQLVQKNAKAKDLLYKSLSRNTLLRVSSCISAHDIWRTLKTDFENQNIKVALMVIEESKIEEKVIGMMAMSNSKTEDEANQVSVSDLKENIHAMSKNQLMDIIVTLMNEMDKMSNGNDQLISNLSCVKLDIKELESDKASLKKQVKDLKNQVLELTSENKKSPDTHGKIKMSDLNTFGIAKNVKKEEEPKVNPPVHTKWIKVNKKIASNPLPFWAKPFKEGVCHLEMGKGPDNRRLGHANLSQLNKLAAKDLVLGLPKVEFTSDKVCDACVRGKHVRSSFKSKKFVSTSKLLELLHMDLYGPMRIRSRRGKRTPQQNGVVKRKNRFLEDTGSTMLIVSGMPKNFWAEAINTACYLLNRCMVRPIFEKTPYELLRGRKSNITYLRAFGCKCFVHNNGKEVLGKFDDRSDEEIFLGYSPHNKAYKVEDYDIGFTGDGDTKESDEDGSENHKKNK